MNLIRTLTTLLAVSVPCCALAFQEDLQPPDANVYLDLQSVYTDFDNFTGAWNSGGRLRVGIQLNEASFGEAVWRFEGGFSQFGQSEFAYQRGPYPGPNAGEETVSAFEEKVRVSGFEAGVKLFDGRLLFARTGVFLYNLKHEVTQTNTISQTSGPASPTTYALPTDSESKSGVGGYLGLGLELSFTERLGAVVEYNHYHVDGEALPNAAVGLHLTF